MTKQEEDARRTIAEAADNWFDGTFKAKLTYPLSEHQARLLGRAAYARGYVLALQEQEKSAIVHG